MNQDQQTHTHTQRCLGGCTLRSLRVRGKVRTAPVTARLIGNASKLSSDFKAIFNAPAMSTRAASRSA